MTRSLLLFVALLLAGCSAPPHPGGPLGSSEVSEAARAMAVKIKKQNRKGWDASVVLDDDVPVLRIGDCDDRTGEHLDTMGLLVRIAWELEQLGAVVFDPDVASLVLDAKLDVKRSPDEAVYTLGLWVTDKESDTNYTIATATKITH